MLVRLAFKGGLVDKTAIYFGSVPGYIQEDILELTGYTKGTFPFRYLGIPLNSKRIAIHDCDKLVDKIMLKIRLWSSRHLTYMARGVLVNAVLMSLHTYWAQIFLIPKQIMDRILQLCRGFLWEGKYMCSKFVPINWEKVCKSKMHGGIGIRDGHMWNKAAQGKLVWQIAMKADILWVKWVHSIYIKDRNWWDYKPPNTASWGWRNVCQVKEDLKHIMDFNQWWNGEQYYSISKGYKALHDIGSRVTWSKWVWSKFNIPKHSFICWMLMMGRLKTRVRMKRFLISDSDMCLLCNARMETCHHVFFGCEVSRRCLDNICQWLNVPLNDDNIEMIWPHWEQHFSSKIKKQVVFCVLACLVYHIWRARNAMLWKGSRPTMEQISLRVKQDVKGRLQTVNQNGWRASERLWIQRLVIR